jgi:ubiquinone/menaquinone biosynthesis C-methylase UbiE/uncharacterized protein YbaR (Trm112 family)
MIKKIITDLCCVNHSCRKERLRLESFLEIEEECIEGFLSCKNCKSKYPIIQGILIIVENFHEYARHRIHTFGKWIVNSKSIEMRAFLREEGAKINNPTYNDRYEKNNIWYKSYLWTHYGYSSNDKLLSLLKQKIKPNNIYKMLASNNINLSGIGLDIGCSIGSSTFELSRRLSYVFGVDLSFSFIAEARKRMQNRKRKNIEFIVADATNLPFKSQFFQTIVALNIIGRMDFNKLIFAINRCIKKQGKLMIVDPYDLGNENIQKNFDSTQIRKNLEEFGYEIRNEESHIPWIIKMNERAYLFYFVDFLEADKKKN